MFREKSRGGQEMEPSEKGQVLAKESSSFKTWFHHHVSAKSPGPTLYQVVLPPHAHLCWFIRPPPPPPHQVIKCWMAGTWCFSFSFFGGTMWHVGSQFPDH